MPGPIARPLMKGHFWNWFKWNVPSVVAGATAIGVAYYYLVGERRKRVYREFYQVCSTSSSALLVSHHIKTSVKFFL